MDIDFSSGRWQQRASAFDGGNKQRWALAFDGGDGRQLWQQWTLERNSASVGSYEGTTDFGSCFGIHSPNAVSIVRTLDVDINSN